MKLYKKLLKYAKEKTLFLYLSIIFSVISVLCLMYGYWNLWKLFESLIVFRNYQEVVKYSVLIVMFILVYALVYFLSLLCSHILGFRLERNFRYIGLVNLINSSFSFFDNNPSGKIRKTIDDNAGQTHVTVAHLIPDNTVAILMPILMLIVTFLVDIKLGILLVLTIIVGIFQYIKMYDGKDFMEKYYASLDKMSQETVEYVRGMQVLKIFGITVRSYKTLIEAIMDYSKYVYNYSMNCRVPYVSFQVFFNMYYLVCIPVGIYLAVRGQNFDVIIAKIIFFACFSGIIFMSFMKIMFSGQNNFLANQAIDNLENLIDSMNINKIDYGNLEKLEKTSIEFKNVSFKYDDKKVFENLSFSLDEGKTYALVGASGSGKSTIVKLIAGFYPVSEGELKIGNHNINEYSEDCLLKNISFVFQNSKLFKTTIYENVLIGNKNATREEVMNALKLANCDSILDKFKERENTIIGTKGVYLSGGEIQRIAIARAILKNSKIIILDEVVSAADPENEYEIQTAFSNLMKNKTTIMIAHRLSSIKNVDEILFVENGNIIERGKHEELMNINGKYKKLQELYSMANDWRVK